jgi:hypothetical protein
LDGVDGIGVTSATELENGDSAGGVYLELGLGLVMTIEGPDCVLEFYLWLIDNLHNVIYSKIT